MRRVAVGVALLVLMGVILTPIVHPVYAQEPGPTPTPTQVYAYDLQLSSGNLVQVERSVTYGDIAIVLVGMLLAGIVILYMLVRLVQLWLR